MISRFFQIWSAPTGHEDLGEGYWSKLDDHKTQRGWSMFRSHHGDQSKRLKGALQNWRQDIWLIF